MPKQSWKRTSKTKVGASRGSGGSRGTCGNGGPERQSTLDVCVCVPGWDRPRTLGPLKGFYFPFGTTKYALWDVCDKQHRPKWNGQHPSEKPAVNLVSNSVSEQTQGLQGCSRLYRAAGPQGAGVLG